LRRLMGSGFTSKKLMAKKAWKIMCNQMTFYRRETNLPQIHYPKLALIRSGRFIKPFSSPTSIAPR
jgi:hypothetical protein